MKLHIKIAKEKDGIMPLVGWHSPHGEAEIDGKKIKICVAGGCRKFLVKIENETSWYSIDLTEIAGDIYELIKKNKEKKNA